MKRWSSQVLSNKIQKLHHVSVIHPLLLLISKVPLFFNFKTNLNFGISSLMTPDDEYIEES